MKTYIQFNKKKIEFEIFKASASNQFHHIPKNFVDPGGLEPPLSEPESDVLATTLWVNKKKTNIL